MGGGETCGLGLECWEYSGREMEKEESSVVDMKEAHGGQGPMRGHTFRSDHFIDTLLQFSHLDPSPNVTVFSAAERVRLLRCSTPDSSAIPYTLMQSTLIT